MSASHGVSPVRSQSRGHFVTEFFAGLGLLFEGFHFLRTQPRLWVLSSVPLAFSVLALGTAGALLYAYAGALTAVIDTLLPVVEVERPIEWIWLGPLKVLLWLVGHIFFGIVAGVSLVFAVLLANVAAAPFLDSLSYHVERTVGGTVLESDDTGIVAAMADAGRSIKGEAQRLLFFLSLWLPLILVGFVVPGLHVITGPLSVVVAVLFLPLDFSGYTLDRRRVSFPMRRRWLRANLGRMLGFGAAAFAACFVPGLNLLMVPVLVVAGTLLVLGAPPESALDPH